MQRIGWMGAGAAGALAVLLISRPNLLPAQTLPREANTQLETVYATLWVRTAGEYEAICLQTYALAAQKAKLLAERSKSSAEGKPPAVVLDLDETVMDTSNFQAELIRTGRKFSDEDFHIWIDKHPEQTKLVPGAKEFIESAESMGLTVFYISNRFDRVRAATIETCRLLGLNIEGIEGRLFLRTDVSDKTARRDKIRQTHEILMLLGDNLADLSGEFAPAGLAKDADPVEARRAAVARSRSKLGETWFVLPNPIYGDWTKLIDWKNPIRYLEPH
jgi:acid phosphatase